MNNYDKIHRASDGAPAVFPTALQALSLTQIEYVSLLRCHASVLAEQGASESNFGMSIGYVLSMLDDTCVFSDERFRCKSVRRERFLYFKEVRVVATKPQPSNLKH